VDESGAVCVRDAAADVTVKLCERVWWVGLDPRPDERLATALQLPAVVPERDANHVSPTQPTDRAKAWEMVRAW